MHAVGAPRDFALTGRLIRTQRSKSWRQRDTPKNDAADKTGLQNLFLCFVLYLLLTIMSSSNSDALRDCSNTSMENNSQQRKRPASTSPLTNNSAAKKSKPSNDDDGNVASTDNTASQCMPPQAEYSIERLLSVPLDVIFRKVASGNRSKPLLTRAEAQCLVKTTQLAHQVDAIVQVSFQALSRQVWCKDFAESIQTVPLLRSVLPLLVVHGTQTTSSALTQVQTELDGVLSELEACAAALQQYSEQNWTLAESLIDAFGGRDMPVSSGQDLAREKRIIAEIQEEVCARCQSVLKMSASLDGTTVEDAFEQARDQESGQFVSMQEYCRRLFGADKTNDSKQSSISATPAAAAAAAALQNEQPNEGNISKNSVSSVNDNGGDKIPPRNEQEQQEESTNATETNNPLLTLAQEAEERGGWSDSTASMQAPERSSPTGDEEEDSQDEDMEHYGEMTQGTSGAVAALAVLRNDQGDD